MFEDVADYVSQHTCVDCDIVCPTDHLQDVEVWLGGHRADMFAVTLQICIAACYEVWGAYDPDLLGVLLAGLVLEARDA